MAILSRSCQDFTTGATGAIGATGAAGLGQVKLTVPPPPPHSIPPLHDANPNADSPEQPLNATVKAMIAIIERMSHSMFAVRLRQKPKTA